MGNVFSSDPSDGRGGNATGESEIEINNMADSASTSSRDNSIDSEEFHDTIDEPDEREERVKAKEAEMEEFRKQLQVKREQRREILDRHKAEKKVLEASLETERKAKLQAYETNKLLRELMLRNNVDIPDNLESLIEDIDIKDTINSMKEEFEELKSNNNKLRRDLAISNSALQSANADIADLQGHHTESIKQINALKEVVAVSKTLLGLREQQLNELKAKLSEIEQSLADREANMLSSDLREEYERQLQNIRNLRGLYEERARLAEVTRQGLLRQLEEQKKLKEAESEKVKELTEKVENLEAKVDELQETVSNKNNQIYTCQDETRGLKSEMSAVNKLFSQVLLGYKNNKDLDTLVHRLEENHGLLTHMAGNEDDSEASSALPKLLLEIISQVDEKNEEEHHKESNVVEQIEDDKSTVPDTQNNATAEEIVANLPKVWRVLMELLSHQTTPEDNTQEKVTTCYKTVETTQGPVMVPSVSQTYIRLKDLIVEKLGLIKEVNRMKQLNVHLETRLGEQEKRLCLVTTELSKTWNVVGRLRRHHHQLHTHEKILKYELQQKRKLLNELKEELEYCREKWEQARQKNTQSEKDWKKLRTEFTSRKAKPSVLFNNSAESGYSDERASDESSESNDESEHVSEPLKRSKKKLKMKSFETILDSSTDRNLAAEREDPVSDMIDVAELPLDTQDGEDHHDISDSCNSESLLKSDRVCETEDEMGDIAHDSCTEELSIGEHSQDNNKCNEINKVEIPCNAIPEIKASVIDPVAIMKSIREQNERLAAKDKKLDRLEKNGAALLQQTQSTAKISEQLNSTLDHLLNRPTSSRNDDPELPPSSLDASTENEPYSSAVDEILRDEMIHSSISCSENNTMLENSEAKAQEDTQSQSTTQVPTVDFKAILEKVRLQDERLTRKDERLEKLEAGCANVVKSISNTVLTGNDIVEKLDRLHSDHNKRVNDENIKANDDIRDESNPILDLPVETTISEIPEVNLKGNSAAMGSQNEIFSSKKEEKEIDDDAAGPSGKDKLFDDNKTETIDQESSSSSSDISEPSSLSEINHEARFAARDIRLKRLEEQTKSLVSQVNKTNTKGVKINYKLEELHNIYGSENSRAGTPSDNEDRDKTNEEEDKPKEGTSDADAAQSEDGNKDL